MLDPLETMIHAAVAVCDGNPPQLDSDDLMIYAGSAMWGDWENHVPGVVRMVWPKLSRESRLAVFLTAKQFTAYKHTGATA